MNEDCSSKGSIYLALNFRPKNLNPTAPFQASLLNLHRKSDLYPTSQSSVSESATFLTTKVGQSEDGGSVQADGGGTKAPQKGLETPEEAG